MNIKQVPASTNNYSTGRGGKSVNKIVLHWIVGTLESADATFKNPERKASAHYGIGDDEIHQYVAEENTAWHAGNFTVNQESIGIEHEGGWKLPDGTRQTPSEKTHQTSGRLVAEIAKRYNIPLDRNHIFPHNKYSNTQCPGTLDIERIIEYAKAEGGDSMQEELDKCRVARDSHWNDLVAIKESLSLPSDAPIDTTLKSIAGIKGEATQARKKAAEAEAEIVNQKDQIKRLKQESANYKNERDTARNTVDARDKTISDLSVTIGGLNKDLARCQAGQEKCTFITLFKSWFG